MRMLSRAPLGHMHKLSHGSAEVREESYYGLGTRTTCESTINPKSKKGTTLKFNRPYMVRRVRQTDLLTDRCNSNRGLTTRPRHNGTLHHPRNGCGGV